MEGGQIALFFIQRIFSLVHSVVYLNALRTFDYHLKPIRMKHILSLIATGFGLSILFWAFLWTLELLGI